MYPPNLASAAPAQSNAIPNYGAQQTAAVQQPGFDPFGYTGGSLLTPWTQQFTYGGPSASANVAAFTPFQFQQMGQTNLGRFNQQAPTAQAYGNFTAPTPSSINTDPSYQFRVNQGVQALQNSAAAKGTLLTGGTAKAIQDYGQQAGSQEFQNIFDRALQSYGTNRDTANSNFANQMQSFGGNLSAFGANAQAGAAEAGLNQNAWQANEGLARTQWQDAANHAQALASAANAANSENYQRALQQYQMAQNTFYTNQDRQYGMLTGLSNQDYRNATLGMGLAGQNAAAVGGIYGQQGAANAGAAMANGNAWQSAINGVGNGLLGYGSGAFGYSSPAQPQYNTAIGLG